MAQLLDDHGLELVQILSPFDWDAGERGIGALPGRRDAFRASIRTALDYSSRVGKPMIHVMPGNIGAELDPARCMELFTENVAWAADAAAVDGITLILEPCCAARFPDFLYHRLDEGVEVIRALNRDNVKLCFDTFHVQMEEGAITQRLHQVYQYIGHVQVGNVPGRHEPGSGVPILHRQFGEKPAQVRIEFKHQVSMVRMGATLAAATQLARKALHGRHEN
jgi:hydroxypyruvate isomerase